MTPDAERTMCTYLGCSILLNENDVNFSILKRAKILYLEGYLWDLDEAKNAFKSDAIECRKNGVKVALSLSDIFCISFKWVEFTVDSPLFILILTSVETIILSNFFNFLIKSSIRTLDNS